MVDGERTQPHGLIVSLPWKPFSRFPRQIVYVVPLGQEEAGSEIEKTERQRDRKREIRGEEEMQTEEEMIY